MGRQSKTPGLKLRGRIWSIDKRVKGYGRLVESCGTTDLEEAERYMNQRLHEIRQAEVYGIRPQRTFKQAAVKYLHQKQEKRSIKRDVYALNRVMPFIGHLRLDREERRCQVHARRAHAAAQRGEIR